MYKVLGSDKREYGPINADVLRQWIRDRRANAETLIQAEGQTDWRPLSSFADFADALAGSPPTPSAPPAMPSSSTSPLSAPLKAIKTSRLAITSLVLGVLGLISCGITAIVGLILGIVSLLQIRNSKGELSGQGIAIAGICVSGAFLLFLPFGLAISLPAFAKAKYRAQSINCVNNLKQIGIASRLWAEDHKGDFPPQLILLTNEISKPSAFSCPADPNAHPPSDFSTFTPRHISYEYLAEGKTTDNPPTALARCPIHGHTVLSDGSVTQTGRR